MREAGEAGGELGARSKEAGGQGAGSKGENTRRACTPPQQKRPGRAGLVPISAPLHGFGAGIAPPANSSLPLRLFGDKVTRGEN